MESKANVNRSIRKMKDFKNPAWKEQVTKVVQQIQELGHKICSIAVYRHKRNAKKPSRQLKKH